MSVYLIPTMSSLIIFINLWWFWQVASNSRSNLELHSIFYLGIAVAMTIYSEHVQLRWTKRCIIRHLFKRINSEYSSPAKSLSLICNVQKPELFASRYILYWYIHIHSIKFDKYLSSIKTILLLLYSISD